MVMVKIEPYKGIAGIFEDDERKAEIESSGLFKLVERVEYVSHYGCFSPKNLSLFQSI